jgi:Spy/CpxP family protein refolding chaperone
MKAIRLLTLLATCLFAMAALAQQNPPADKSGDDKHGGHMDMSHDMGMGHDMGSVDDHVKQLSTKLNLTADQQAKIKAIMEEQNQQMQTVMKDDSLSMDAKHAKMHSMHEATHAKVRELLNDEQKTKFDAMVKDMDGRMHGQHDKDKDHDKDHK